MAEYDDKKPRAEDLLFSPVIPRNLALLPVLVLSPQSRMSYAKTKKNPTLAAKGQPFSIAALGIAMAATVANAMSSSLSIGRGAGGPATPSGPGFGGR